MANDGTVKIGAEIDEKEFLDSLSNLSKTAKSTLRLIKKVFPLTYQNLGRTPSRLKFL